MNLTNWVLRIAFQSALLCLFYMDGTVVADDVWKEPFGKRLDAGNLTGPLPNSQYPPSLELIFLSWDGTWLEASGDYYNFSSAPAEVQGCEIVNAVTGVSRFYPEATLEVSNDRINGWQAIGTSPSSERGTTIVVTMNPNFPPERTSGMKPNRACFIELEALRSQIGKFRYGRAILKNGASTQVLILTNLLPSQHEE